MGFMDNDRRFGDGTSATSQDGGERIERLAALKRAIEAGTYQVSSAALANCLLRQMLQTKRQRLGLA